MSIDDRIALRNALACGLRASAPCALTIGGDPSVSVGSQLVSLPSDDDDNGGVVALETTDDGMVLPLDGASCTLGLGGELIVTAAAGGAEEEEEEAAESRAGKRTIEMALLAVSLWSQIEG